MTTNDKLNSRAFNSLPFREKLDVLYGVSAVEKRDLIIGAPDAERIVRSFAVESLFFTLKEIGLEDTTELVALASGDQICGLVDLDCWKKDRFDVDEVLEWLAIIADAGSRPLGELLNSIDRPLLVLFLKRFIRVRRLEDPEEPFEDLEGGEVFELDAHYEIGFHRWDARAHLVRRLLEELHERDYGYFVTVMEEIWWGVDSELEEISFQARNSRLQDRGFPDFYEALEIYRPLTERDLPDREAPLRRRSAHDPEEDVPLAQALLLPDEVRSLFGEILSRAFAAENGDELREEMTFLANRVMVADGVDFADREAVAAAVRVAHDTLNLAVETLSAGERERAIALVQRHHLLHLFRFGWHLLLELRRLAKRAEEDLGLGLAASEILFLDSPHREALSGFARAKPRWFEGLDTPGELRYRSIADRSELERAERMIAEVAGLPELFADILGQTLAKVASLRPAAADDFRASAAILTGFARFVIDGSPSLSPLAPDELRALRAATGDADAHLRADVRERFVEFVGKPSAYLDFCFRRFEDEFLALDPAYEIDPRFFTCLMVAVGKAGNAKSARP